TFWIVVEDASVAWLHGTPQTLARDMPQVAASLLYRAQRRIDHLAFCKSVTQLKRVEASNALPSLYSGRLRLRDDAQRAQRRVGRPLDEDALGRAGPQVVDDVLGDPLAGDEQRDPRRVRRHELGRDTSHGIGDRHHVRRRI